MHEMTHTGVKPFTCTKCDKAFACRSDLKKHENLHRRQEVWVIFVMKKPTLVTNLRLAQSVTRNLINSFHEQTHTGEKPYPCKECVNTFKNSQK